MRSDLSEVKLHSLIFAVLSVRRTTSTMFCVEVQADDDHGGLRSGRKEFT